MPWKWKRKGRNEKHPRKKITTKHTYYWHFLYFGTFPLRFVTFYALFIVYFSLHRTPHTLFKFHSDAETYYWLLIHSFYFRVVFVLYGPKPIRVSLAPINTCRSFFFHFFSSILVCVKHNFIRCSCLSLVLRLIRLSFFPCHFIPFASTFEVKIISLEKVLRHPANSCYSQI